jgi:glycosyltransferase involved in cell wall biosynthesis
VEIQAMKVLIVATAFPRFTGDVITPWLVEIIKRLRDHGVEVSVITSSYRGLGNQIIEGIPVYRFRYFLKDYERLTHEETAVDRFQRGIFNKILSIFYIIAGAVAISRLVRKKRFDIVHVHWPFPHIIFGLLGRGFGNAGLVASFHGAEIRWLKKKFPFFINCFSWMINKADTVTTNSRHTARELTDIVKRRIEIIPFGAAVKPRPGSAMDKKEIIFVGRLVERKGVKYLIQAYHRIRDEIPHRLIIIGDGPQRNALEELVQGLDLKDRVIFAGMIPTHDLEGYYKNCSFMVLPAVYDRKGDTEGLGVVLLEAMSYSKPVVASRIGGITDIVADQVNGILVPPEDCNALAAAIKTLAIDEVGRERMGREAKRIVDERFNWDKITKDLITVYEEND